MFTNVKNTNMVIANNEKKNQTNKPIYNFTYNHQGNEGDSKQAKQY